MYLPNLKSVALLFPEMSTVKNFGQFLWLAPTRSLLAYSFPKAFQSIQTIPLRALVFPQFSIVVLGGGCVMRTPILGNRRHRGSGISLETALVSSSRTVPTFSLPKIPACNHVPLEYAYAYETGRGSPPPQKKKSGKIFFGLLLCKIRAFSGKKSRQIPEFC